jgi:hypothetical protein
MVSAMVVLGAAPASAAPPSNDTIGGATVITTMPFNETVDTTEATTDADDAALNTTCGAPATNGSVWYTFVAGEAPAYAVDASLSDFEAGVLVAQGTPGNLTVVACGPFSVAVESPVPGETYYVMAFSFDPETVGGQLSISVFESEPAPKISMTVHDVGKVDRKTGAATISGTYTCIGNADIVVLQGQLQQEQGDVQVSGIFEQQITRTCGGTFEWSAEIVPETGKFVRGVAATFATSVGCNAVGCNSFDTLEVVSLRNGH